MKKVPVKSIFDVLNFIYFPKIDNLLYFNASVFAMMSKSKDSDLICQFLCVQQRSLVSNNCIHFFLMKI